MVPLLMMDQNLHQSISKRLNLQENDNDNKVKNSWIDMVNRIDNAEQEITIALIGKYIAQADAYHSVISSLKHASIFTNQKLKLKMIESSNLEDSIKNSDPELYNEAWNTLKNADGILVPGGFGNRGIEGMISAIKYVRENKIPFLGICLGMQVAVIEYTRMFLSRPKANSREFNPSLIDEDAAIIFMPEGDKDNMGGTMRLGSRRTILRNGSKIKELYHNSQYIDERHRHRYEVNPNLVEILEKKGLKFTGQDESGMRQECIELENHPYFIAVQFHPEFKSRPMTPSPPFLGLLQSAKEKRMKNL
jgi:CTP synthase